MATTAQSNNDPLTRQVFPLDPDLFRYSASQISIFRRCPRKWYFEKVAGLPRAPSGPAARAGTAIHKEVEDWYLAGVPPELGPALALLKHLPTAGDGIGLGQVEHAFRTNTPPGIVSGFIDLIILDPSGIPEQRWPDRKRPDLPIIYDHKSVSDLSRAKTEQDLRLDPQILLYGLAARAAKPEIEDLYLQWNYVSRTARALSFDGVKDFQTKPVRIRQTLSVLEEGLVGIFADAVEMRVLATSVGCAADVEGRRSACGDYGGCPYREHCPIGQTQAPKEEPVSEDIFSKLRSLRAAEPVLAAVEPVVIEHATVGAAGAPQSTRVEPTPEPDIRQLPLNVSGLGDPLPDTAAGVLPPDAPAVPPVVPAVPVEPKPAKRGPGRPRKGSVPVPEGASGEAGTLTGNDTMAVRLLAEAEALREHKYYSEAGILLQAAAILLKPL